MTSLSLGSCIVNDDIPTDPFTILLDRSRSCSSSSAKPCENEADLLPHRGKQNDLIERDQKLRSASIHMVDYIVIGGELAGIVTACFHASVVVCGRFGLVVVHVLVYSIQPSSERRVLFYQSLPILRCINPVRQFMSISFDASCLPLLLELANGPNLLLMA